MEISTKSERFGDFFTLCSSDEKGRKIKYIFMDHRPVIHFDIDSPAERKIALIQLVERGICNIKTAGDLCGFHRNTAGKILQTKSILGIEAVLSDDRGLKKPYKYVDDVRSHIQNLLSEHPQWKDQDVADQGLSGSPHQYFPQRSSQNSHRGGGTALVANQSRVFRYGQRSRGF
ncbi:MAG TPA: hypothetical protein HPP59_01370 [Deltaproteobacteria bacterium]|nr:hypothetical protein [Deltaproteobacteria bacterium]